MDFWSTFLKGQALKVKDDKKEDQLSAIANNLTHSSMLLNLKLEVFHYTWITWITLTQISNSNRSTLEIIFFKFRLTEMSAELKISFYRLKVLSCEDLGALRWETDEVCCITCIIWAWLTFKISHFLFIIQLEYNSKDALLYSAILKRSGRNKSYCGMLVERAKWLRSEGEKQNGKQLLMIKGKGEIHTTKCKIRGRKFRLK